MRVGDRSGRMEDDLYHQVHGKWGVECHESAHQVYQSCFVCMCVCMYGCGTADKSASFETSTFIPTYPQRTLTLVHVDFPLSVPRLAAIPLVLTFGYK